MTYTFAFLFALAASVLISPRLITVAKSLQLYDNPNGRKVHDTLIPRIGGIAIALSVVVALLLMQQLEPGLSGFVLGTLIVFVIGIYDDLVGISWRAKFVGQLFAVSIALVMIHPTLSGVQLFGAHILIPGWLFYAGAVLVIIGGVNSLNLLDGLDGLASGVSLLIFIGYGYHAILSGNVIVILISLAFAGALLGFLRYNFYPAKIFLGDSGSLFLGFALATVPLLNIPPNGTLNLTIPCILLSLPVLDTLRVIFTRLSLRRNPFLPDQTHLHHRLLSIGMRHDFTVLAMHGLTAMFVILSFFVGNTPMLVVGISYSGLVLITLNLPRIVQFLRKFQWLYNRYKKIENNYPLIGIQSIASFGANHGVIKHSILGFLFTQFILMDYHSIFLYPLAFGLAALILYFYFSSGTWSDHYLMIIVLFSVVYFQTIAQVNTPAMSSTLIEVISVANEVFIAFIFIGVSCVMISHDKKEKQAILKPVDYLVLILLFIIFFMPLEQFGLHLERYNLAKAAIVYLGVKSLFSFSVHKNRRIIFSILILLLATGGVGAFF